MYVLMERKETHSPEVSVFISFSTGEKTSDG